MSGAASSAYAQANASRASKSDFMILPLQHPDTLINVTVEEPDKSAQKIKAEQKNTIRILSNIRCIEYNQKAVCCQVKNFF
jgi:hypothetical protein